MPDDAEAAGGGSVEYRIGVLQGRVDSHDRKLAEINEHLDRQDAAAAQRQRADEERTSDMLRQLGAMQQLTTETTRQSKLYQSQIGSLDAHRKAHAAEQDAKMDALAQGQSALTTEVSDLKQINADRARIEDEAKALAATRHAETLAAARDMRNSFNVVTAIFPGVVVWLLQGGAHATLRGLLTGVAVTAAIVGWNFVPALVRWLRLRFGR